MDMNIYELIRGRSHYVAEERIRRYMYQLIKAMDHMHKAGIFHRSDSAASVSSWRLLDACRLIYTSLYRLHNGNLCYVVLAQVYSFTVLIPGI